MDREYWGWGGGEAFPTFLIPHPIRLYHMPLLSFDVAQLIGHQSHILVNLGLGRQEGVKGEIGGGSSP